MGCGCSAKSLESSYSYNLWLCRIIPKSKQRMQVTNLANHTSIPNEVIMTPFMGVGSEVYSPISLGRKAIGIELKDSYYKQSVLNVKEAEKRFAAKPKQLSFI